MNEEELGPLIEEVEQRRRADTPFHITCAKVWLDAVRGVSVETFEELGRVKPADRADILDLPKWMSRSRSSGDAGIAAFVGFTALAARRLGVTG
ncbi:MAG: hypothetical protein WEA10_06780 [Actinomycetota bacterium]